jgi:RNA polymerase sigma factor (sigma-70 family)
MTKTLDEIRRLFGEGSVAGLSDGQLLERFVMSGDGEAFAAIVARHGGLVLSACRSALGSGGDAAAEDAFQATFLVLVRRAGSFPLQGSLAGWLYRVARRVSRQARIEAARRRSRERARAVRGAVEPPHDPARDEIRRLIHQELAELPERYRAPIVLCDLEGLTRDEAAEALGCPPGTVAGRLARARERLRGRLARRGVTSPSALALMMAPSIDERTRLFRVTTRAALAAGRGEAVATAVARLAAQGAPRMLRLRPPAALMFLTALAALGVAMTALAFRAAGGSHSTPPTTPGSKVAPIPGNQAGAQTPIDPNDPATADLFAGRVVDVEGKPISGAEIYLVPQSPAPTGAGEVRAVTEGDGRFQFSAKDMTFTSLDGLPARRPGLLIATAEGYGPDWIQTWGQTNSSFVSHLDPVKGAEWTLTLPRDDVPIRGRLLDPEGLPLAGATVTLTGLNVPRKRDLDAHLEKMKSPASLFAMADYDRSLYEPDVLPGVTAEFVTDADGRFRLDGLGRERLAALEIRGSGAVDTSIEVMTREAPEVRVRWIGATEDTVIHGADFTLTLKPGRTVTGMVRDRTTGEPLADVWVGPRLASIAGLKTGRYPISTDEQGRFAIPGISPDLKEFDILAVPKPGQPYFLAKASVNDAGEAVVDCPRGIPFRLSLRDEAGRPVEAEVSYSAIQQNELFYRTFRDISTQAGTPLSRAARQADGSYLGVALPGPGVVLAETPRKAGYRPAHVDPKAFFAPGRTDWTAQDLITTYGNHDTLSVATFFGGAWVDQHDYAAIVLINPEEGAKPLELSATVAPDRPRQVTLLDPEGRPVVGAQSTGLTYHPWDSEPRLRAATFPIAGLHPDRARRITFVKEDRKLIGFLLARGDADAPYTVHMQPWATVTGRIVDERGRPLRAAGPPGKSMSRAGLSSGTKREFAAHDDPEAGIFPSIGADEHGRFRVDRLVPGLSYSADVYVDAGRPGGTAFEGLKLAPGEVRDLGDIQVMPPAASDAGPRPTVTPPNPGAPGHRR